MIGQRSVREAELRSRRRPNRVDDATAVQRPESDVAGENGDDRARCDRRTFRKELDPPDLEMSPFGQRRRRASEGGAAGTDDRDVFVHAEAVVSALREADRRIRQRELPRCVEETTDALW